MSSNQISKVPTLHFACSVSVTSMLLSLITVILSSHAEKLGKRIRKYTPLLGRGGFSYPALNFVSPFHLLLMLCSTLLRLFYDELHDYIINCISENSDISVNCQLHCSLFSRHLLYQWSAEVEVLNRFFCSYSS